MPQPLFAQVIIDIPTRAFDSAFNYTVPDELAPQTQVGCCVLVDFARRPSLGYVVGLCDAPASALDDDKIKPVLAVLSPPRFNKAAAQLAQWMAHEYLAPLSETLHLFTPPGPAPRLRQDASGGWQLEEQGATPVDDRWAGLTEEGRAFEPKANAVKQRAILSALRISQMRVADLALEVSNPTVPLKALEKKGLVFIEARRRIRGNRSPLPPTTDIAELTVGQREALDAILASLCTPGLTLASPSNDSNHLVTPGLTRGLPQRLQNDSDCRPEDSQNTSSTILLDGVTGSGKTEVYLQAIRTVLEGDSNTAPGTAIVLVPEISLTPQTVARFRSRFGDAVAVLHSRLSTGERFDQWDLVRSGTARVVVGARSALFAPAQNLRLIVIDEEHEGSYKQSSSPRYVTRDVAARLAQLSGATLVLGSATPSMEALHQVATGASTLVRLPERVTGKPLPPIQVVDLSVQFRSGNKTMFSYPLKEALLQTIERREKAVLLLNKRGFASFLLCRDCGFVPTCESCATSFTYHAHPARLLCHHCGATAIPPATCPDCGSSYLKQLGPGTQFAFDQLQAILPAGTPIVRMDADTTRGKAGHERCLDEFIAAPYGVLLGTQMIAKGLDFPEVTLVGVLIADISLKFPDFRAPERTYQLLEQVAGRAGRAEKDGRVIVQTYWPQHVAIRAAATHNRELLFDEERELRSEIGYPPYVRLANILLWGKDLKEVSAEALKLTAALDAHITSLVTPGAEADHTNSSVTPGLTRGLPQHLQGDSGCRPEDSQMTQPIVQVLGPSPCVLSKRQGNYRWHILLKAPSDTDLPGFIAPVIRARKTTEGVSVAIDIDPYDLL
ncbi:MAG: primosomal protein N' [Coriobacteriia bacterium]|nr:primosomal protein N' [Coriobacteriia bacterium]